MNSKQKYLKYKVKYLNLKKQLDLKSQDLKSQSGGEPPKNILIVSHNNRIRCLLSKLYGTDIPRFKNTAIIKLEIRSDDTNVRTILVHEGEVNNPKKSYVVIEKPLAGSLNIQLPPGFPKSNLNIPENYKKTSYDIYIVRHGEGTHNVKNGVYIEEDDMDEKTQEPHADEATCAKELTAEENCVAGSATAAKCPPPLDIKPVIEKVDTNLTPEGIKQANKAGEKIKDIGFTAAFVSDLFRTIQTLNGLQIPQIVNNALKPYVLPCSHEIQYIKGSSKTCDGHIRNNRCTAAEAVRKSFAPENISICRKNRTHERCLKPEHAIRQWDKYDKHPESFCAGPNNNMVERAIVIAEELFKQGV